MGKGTKIRSVPSPSVGLGGQVDRRHFLSRGAVGVSGILAAREASGEVPRDETLPDADRPALPPDEMDAYLATMDAGAARLAAWPLHESFPGLPADRPELAAVGRAAMHSLYMAGMFGDLPLENQVDRRVQDRLWASQPVMDEALSGIEDYLARRTATDLAGVRETLRSRPEVLHAIIGTVDEEAGRSGVSDARRAQLRTLFTEVGWRLTNQPPELIVREYADKVERVTASDVQSEARRRWLASRVGEAAFWQAQESLRKRRISRGLRAMGIGVVLLAGGALLISLGSRGGGNEALLWIGLIPGITGGSIFLVIGLITLLAGALTARDATTKKNDKQE